MIRCLRLSWLCLLAALVAGCLVPVPAAPPVAPELLAGTMRQFNFRSEFADALAPLKARDWPALVKLARARLEREPSRGEWWKIAGYGQMQAGELALAQDSLERAGKLLPEEVGVWSLLAEVERRAGNPGAALRTLERALQTDPISTIALVQQGDLLAEQRRDREALRSFDRALEIDRRDLFAWRSLGLLARRNGDAASLERAVKALQQLYPPFADEIAGVR
ncbi:MAG: tetratricopeptide repeat protein [Burkholderiales bacterium]